MQQELSDDAPLVTVVMPVYNAMPYLARALDTLLDQNLGELELICIDDASEDGSYMLLEEYASHDPRIRIIRQEHVGAATARNLGLAHASGKYLYFADADDWFAPTMLERVVRRAEETQAEIVLFNAVIYYLAEQRAKEPRHYLRQKQLPANEVFSRKDCENGSLLYLTISAAWNKLYLRSFVQANDLRFQILPNSNDTLFMIASMSLAERIAVLNECLMTHTTQNRKSLQGSREAEPLSFLQAYEASYDFLQSSGLYDDVRQGFDNKFIWQAVDELNHSHRADARKRIVQAISQSKLMATGVMNHVDAYYFALGRKHFLASALDAWDKGNFLRTMQVSDNDVEALEQSLNVPLPAEQNEESDLEGIAQSYRAFLCWRRLSHLATHTESEDASFALHDRAENVRSVAVLSYARVKPEEQNFYFCLDPNDYYEFRFQVVQPAAALKKRQALEKTETKLDRLSRNNKALKENYSQLKEKLKATSNALKAKAEMSRSDLSRKMKVKTMFETNKLKYQEMIDGSIAKELKDNKIRGALVNTQDVSDIRTALLKVGPEFSFEVTCDNKRKTLTKFKEFKNHGYSVTLTDEQLLRLDDSFEVTLMDKETEKIITTRMMKNTPKKALLEQKTEHENHVKMIDGSIAKELKDNKIRGFLVNTQAVSDIRTALLKVGPELSFEVTCDNKRKTLNKFKEFKNHGYIVTLTDEQLLLLDDSFEVTLMDKETGKIVTTRMMENTPKKALLEQKAEHENHVEMIDGSIVKELKDNKIRGVLVNMQDVSDIRTALLKVGPELSFEVMCDNKRKTLIKFKEFKNHGYSVTLTDEQLLLLDDSFKVTLMDKETGKIITTRMMKNTPKKALLEQKAEHKNHV